MLQHQVIHTSPFSCLPMSRLTEIAGSLVHRATVVFCSQVEMRMKNMFRELVQFLKTHTLTRMMSYVRQLISRPLIDKFHSHPFLHRQQHRRYRDVSLESERGEVYKVGTEPGAGHCVTRVPLDNMCRYCALLVSPHTTISCSTIHRQLICLHHVVSYVNDCVVFTIQV